MFDIHVLSVITILQETDSDIYLCKNTWAVRKFINGVITLGSNRGLPLTVTDTPCMKLHLRLPEISGFCGQIWFSFIVMWSYNIMDFVYHISLLSWLKYLSFISEVSNATTKIYFFNPGDKFERQLINRAYLWKINKYSIHILASARKVPSSCEYGHIAYSSFCYAWIL